MAVFNKLTSLVGADSSITTWSQRLGRQSLSQVITGKVALPSSLLVALCAEPRDLQRKDDKVICGRYFR